MDRISRQIANSKQDRIQIVKSQPSGASLREGQEVIYVTKDNRIARYRKEQGRVWVSYMNSNENQIVDRDLIVKRNINLSGKLITKDYPAFGVRQSTGSDGQQIETGAYETIVFNQELYDNGGHFDVSNYSFTAPYDGIYHFNARALWDGNETADDGDWEVGDKHIISLFKNDRNAAPNSTNTVASNRKTIQGDINDTYISNNVVSDLQLDAGDYISVALYHDTDAGHSQYTYQPTNTYAWTSFTGHLVCAL
jgi:hypothetical protein